MAERFVLPRRGLRMVGAGAWILWACAALPGHAADTAKTCWAPQELRAQPGEAQIRKGIAAAFVAFPSARPQSLPRLADNRRGVIRRVNLPAGVKRIALTFDLCEQPYEITGYQGDIVDYLRSRNIPATFFAGGKWLLTHTRRATQLMADRRFEVANHSWEHRNHRLIEGRSLVNAIEGAQAAYEVTRRKLQTSACVVPGTSIPAFTHIPPSQKLFRFPFGACNQQSLDAVNDRGLLAIQWDVSSADPWRGMTADAMVRHVVARVRPGSIVLFHANGRGWNTGTAIPRIIDELRARGYEFDTVGGLLATPGAEPVIMKTCYDARPGDSDRYDRLGQKLIDQYNAFYAKFAPGRSSQ